MATARLLIIDDEPGILKQVSGLMEDEGYSTVTANGGEKGIKAFRAWDIPGAARRLYARDGRARGTRESQGNKSKCPRDDGIGPGQHRRRGQGHQLGATDFIEKPFQPERLLVSVANTLELHACEAKTSAQRRAQPEPRHDRRERGMRALRDEITKAAPSKIRVLISGATEPARNSWPLRFMKTAREATSFVKLNCAALPKDLIESELFGYEKGAFTGATTGKQGKFELADGGTLLLDEIGDMSLDTQAKLLRVLEEEEFERLGSRRPIKVDVRVISSTNKNLQEEIKKGNFREDLYYRIAAMPIQVPPLRERKDDIRPLVEHFLRLFRQENNRPAREFTDGAIRVLMSYDWPGNVRELKNLVERLVIMAEHDTIDEDDIKPLLSEARIAIGDKPLGELIEDFERSLIRSEAKKTGWNVSKAASRLGIDRANLHRKMRRYGISREDEPGVSGDEA